MKYIFVSNLKDGSKEWTSSTAAIKEFLKYPLMDGADSIEWKKFFSSLKPMKADKNGLIKTGKFPLVLLIHGNAAEYSMMAEYLVSHGMIAVNVPTRGYMNEDLDVNLIGLETQIRDHEFAIDFVRRKFSVFDNKIAAIGMSFGGQSALGLAIRNPSVKSVISLDGGIGSQFGGQLLAASPFYNVEAITMPILHLYNPADPGGSLNWFAEYKYSDRTLVAYKNMIHPYFLVYGHLSNSVKNSWGKTSPVAGNNYESVLWFTLQFINESFSNSSKIQKNKVEAQENWVVSGLDSISFRKGISVSLSLAFLQDVLSQGGLAGFRESI